MQIEYRIAGPEDLAELCALVQKAIETMIEHHIDQWDERYPDEDILREDVQKGQLYVGIVENPFALRLYESLGYVGVGYVHWRKGKFRLMEKEI